MAVIRETAEPDYSLPLSTLLREGTAESHEAAEKSEGAGWLVRGELDRDEYVRFLMMLWHVYDALEQGLERHATYPTLQPTYNPTMFARIPSLSADIAYLLNVPESSWKEHPAHRTLVTSPPAPFTAYVSRLREISDSDDPSPLLAHAYVRYLGDLSGGQFIKRRVAKAYDLDAADGSGVKFYDFKELGGNKSGNMGDMKKVKEWYRKGMDDGAGDNKKVKEKILQEALRAFDLNRDIFSVLRAPSSLTPTSDKSVEPKVLPVQIAHGPPQERMVTLGNIISVVAAICLAHFLLVVGGFTSTRGYEKLELLEKWLDRIFQ